MSNWRYPGPITEEDPILILDTGTLALTENPLPEVVGAQLAKIKAPPGINPRIWDEIHNYRYPSKRKLQCCLFWTSNTKKNSAKTYINAANSLLTDHNLILDICPENAKKTTERTIEFNELVDISHYEELRNLVHRNHRHNGRIPIIFCRFAGSLGGESHDTGMTINIEHWLPFILINDDKEIMDNLTLLHEIGHASNCEHVNSGNNAAVHNFMDYPPPKRVGILKKQVIKLARSYFAREA